MLIFRTPNWVPAWVTIPFLPVGLGICVALLYADHWSIAGWLIILWCVGFLALVAADVLLAHRRSRALRARLTPADVAARVDLQAVAAVLTSGRPRAAYGGARMVQKAFPHLTAHRRGEHRTGGEQPQRVRERRLAGGYRLTGTFVRVVFGATVHRIHLVEAQEPSRRRRFSRFSQGAQPAGHEETR